MSVYIIESCLATVNLDGRFLGVSVLLLIFPFSNHLWNLYYALGTRKAKMNGKHPWPWNGELSFVLCLYPGFLKSSLRAGVPNPQATDWYEAAQQEVSGGRASKASSVFIAAPHRSHYYLSSTSCQRYGELYNYFIIYYNVIIIEMKAQ